MKRAVLSGLLASILGISSPPTPKTYQTNFPTNENPISENGNWINGGTTGLDWSDVQVNNGLAFGTITGSTPNYGDSTAVLAGTWASNQQACATVHTVNQTTTIHEEVELRTRTTIKPHSITGYEYDYRVTVGGSQYVAIVRWNGPLGSFTYVTNINPGGPGLHNGDQICATAVGSVLSLYINGALISQGNDSTFTTGSPGIGMDVESSSGSLVDQNFGFTSFSATELNGNAPPAPTNLRVTDVQ